ASVRLVRAPCSCALVSLASRRRLHAFPTRRSSDLTTAADSPLPRSRGRVGVGHARPRRDLERPLPASPRNRGEGQSRAHARSPRAEEHTSELQSREKLVCRRRLETTNQTSGHLAAK